MMHMDCRFSIKQWAAWAPGLADHEAWHEWLSSPRAPVGDMQPALIEMPAMMRRRVERLGRAALQVAYRTVVGASACPTVFASRYGDMQRSIELMKQLASEATVSPTAFSMSVHNANAALFSIARGDRSNYSAVSAGAETAENAFVEALGLLMDGAHEVIVVYYDEPLPAPMAHFSPDGEFVRAWACRIGRADAGGVGVALHTGDALPSSEAAADATMPSDLALLDFLVGTRGSYHRRIEGREWRWERA
jgi:hypothetical protein